jgi:hypothetical protein
LEMVEVAKGGAFDAKIVYDEGDGDATGVVG